MNSQNMLIFGRNFAERESFLSRLTNKEKVQKNMIAKKDSFIDVDGNTLIFSVYPSLSEEAQYHGPSADGIILVVSKGDFQSETDIGKEMEGLLALLNQIQSKFYLISRNLQEDKLEELKEKLSSHVKDPQKNQIICDKSQIRRLFQRGKIDYRRVEGWVGRSRQLNTNILQDDSKKRVEQKDSQKPKVCSCIVM